MTTRVDVPIGQQEIAALLGRPENTVWVWRYRGVLPLEDGWVSGIPWWWRNRTIIPWARETGRLTAAPNGGSRGPAMTFKANDTQSGDR
jgi:hypothetical protein